MESRIVECGMFDARQGRVRDALLRGAGVVSLVSGGLLMSWLFNSPAIHQHHDPSFMALAAAALGFLCLSAGAAVTMLGGHIFDQVEISERWARRPYASGEDRRGLSSPAFLALPDNDFDASVSRAVPDQIPIRRAAGPWGIGGSHAHQ